MNADTIFFSAWLAFVVAVFADFAVHELVGSRVPRDRDPEGDAR